MGEKKRISVLFNKYITEDASRSEIKELLDLMKDGKSDIDLEGDMKHLWTLQDGSSTENVDWQRIYDNATASQKRQSLYFGRKIWLRAAAAIFIGLLSAAIWQTKHKADTVEVTYLDGKAMPGKTLVVFLNDGTKVTLNSGSEMRYPKTFASGKREVYLNGEAYFEVAHDPAKSFLVHSGKVVTSVLGTSFNVTAYAGLSNMSVTVLTGKVAVKNMTSEKMVTLTPQLRAVLKEGKAGFAVDSVKDLSESIAWEKGELIFNNASLEEIALKVGYRYGIHVNITDKEKSQRKITGTFNKQSFMEIMNAVTRLTETRYKGSNNSYTIY